MTKETWTTENFGDVLTQYRVKKVLHERQTQFQRLLVVESCAYGRMLILDERVQTSERDEFIYHEMMTHVPLLAHPDPRRVLIIGGGDGGILREVLRHPSVEKATLVEIDREVIAFSREHLPTICQDAFDDPRVEIVIADGVEFVKSAPGKYDVAIVDSPDPIGPAKALFAAEFYKGVRSVLTQAGIMARQTGSSFLQPEEQREAMRLLRDIFTHNALYVFAVPTYIGGFFTSVFSSMGTDPRAIAEEALQKRFADTGLKTRYYHPGVHVGAFRIPGYLKGEQAV